jgi:hypothetical protein
MNRGNDEDRMERWEFCYVDLLNRTIVRLTENGLQREKVKKDQSRDDDSKADATARAVARMGMEGWEMTNGSGDVAPVLFFKRRIP